MKEMTEKALKEAFAGESKAHMKYSIYSEIAQEKGYENLARMWEAIAYAERVHARNHAENLGLIGDLEEDLEESFDGESFEVDEMYPVYHETANIQAENGARRSFHYALEAEKIHKTMYEQAEEKVEKGEDMDIDEIYICPTCGYTHYKGELPDKCPVCGVKKEKFKEF